MNAYSMNFKQFAICVICLVFFSANSVRAEGVGFSDVKEDHPNFSAIEFLRQEGVIKGRSEKIFSPESKVNRAEALKMILVGLGENKITLPSTESDPKALGFKDIVVKDWYLPYLRVALEKKIIGGYPDKTFRPQKEINRAEGLKIIISLFDQEGLKNPGEHGFSDVKKNDWFHTFFAYAQNKNLLSPNKDGLAHPELALTRAELAELIYRLIIIKKQNWTRYQEWISWPEQNLNFARSKVNIPRNWQAMRTGKEMTFWLNDDAMLQTNPNLIYPESARVRIFLDNPNLERDQYFENIKNALTGELDVVNQEGGRLKIAAEKINYFFNFIDKNTVVVMTAEWGEGKNKAAKKNIMADIFASHTVIAAESEEEKKANLLALTRELINVEKKGKDTLNKISDLILINTDAIGVGTGPVDYYYSPLLDYTLKYERGFDVILDLRSGRTDKF